MIIFKILLIILVALPVLALAGIWFAGIRGFARNMNKRDEERQRRDSARSGRSQQ
jgi:hypothetical protein